MTIEWVPLSALREGAIFETKDGIRAVKSEYRWERGGCECVLLESGEYAHFAEDDPAAHNATLVREISIEPCSRGEIPPAVRRPATSVCCPECGKTQEANIDTCSVCDTVLTVTDRGDS